MPILKNSTKDRYREELGSFLFRIYLTMQNHDEGGSSYSFDFDTETDMKIAHENICKAILQGGLIQYESRYVLMPVINAKYIEYIYASKLFWVPEKMEPHKFVHANTPCNWQGDCERVQAWLAHPDFGALKMKFQLGIK